MHVHTIASRPHVQGSPAPLRLRHSAGELSDGAGLLLVRRLWDRLGLGKRVDSGAAWLGGQYRPSLLVELWVVLLLYGGGCMDDLSLLWQMVRARWAAIEVPRRVMLILDSTVVPRYGLKQARAEKRYNAKKPGRPSHHPLVAFLGETGDCMGVLWRAGSAHTAAGAIPWIQTLVDRLRAAGVEEITIRLDKGFFSKEMVCALEALNVRYALKVPDHAWVRHRLGAYRRSRKDPRLWTASGALYGARLLTIQQRSEITSAEGELDLGSFRVEKTAHVLTNVEGAHAHALSAKIE